MATDATGTPTSLGIRKYNTSVDAPSGLGFNGAMDDIDALLVARVTKPTGILTNDVPVWNGTTWVKPTGSHTGTNFLRDDGSWAAAASTTYRKTTVKAINTTVVATDLLNGEITIGAGAMGATGGLRFTAAGDFLNNSGGLAAPPRLQLVLGGVTLIDTGTSGTVTNEVTRRYWFLDALILNSAAGAQVLTKFHFSLGQGGNTTAILNAFTTGTGLYTTAQSGAGGTVAHTLASGTNSGTAVNTAIAALLALNTINGSASASYEMKLFGALAEVI